MDKKTALLMLARESHDLTEEHVKFLETNYDTLDPADIDELGGILAAQAQGHIDELDVSISFLQLMGDQMSQIYQKHSKLLETQS